MSLAGAELSRGDAIAELVDRLCAMLVAAEDEFNALDRAIGDGDHGTNLARAARSLAPLRDELGSMAPGDALVRAGRTIVMSVGGASGPLYGTLLMEMGKALPAAPAAPAVADWARALTFGIEAVARRGRAQEGDKTMLDVLAPAARAFERHAPEGGQAAIAAMRKGAEEGLAAQRALLARRGRAAYVGTRSEGADDAGAASVFRCLVLVADVLRGGQS